MTDRNFLTINEQVDLLKSRGMHFDNEERAKKYLAYIGYHRLSLYWNGYFVNKIKRDRFRGSINFDDILDLYIFDRKMRGLFFEAAERIEICLKVLFSNVMSEKYGSEWYLNKSLFTSRIDTFYVNGEETKVEVNQQTLLDDLNQTIRKNKKNNPALAGFTELKKTILPSWELFNLMTFGDFSRTIALVDGTDSKTFYESFELPKAIADSWVECIVSVRNICAHYGYFSKRSFSVTPRPLNKSKKRTFSIDFEGYLYKFYTQYFVFSYFLSKISPTTSWMQRVKDLIEEYKENPYISYEILGFPDNWSETDIAIKRANDYICGKNRENFKSFDVVDDAMVDLLGKEDGC